MGRDKVWLYVFPFLKFEVSNKIRFRITLISHKYESDNFDCIWDRYEFGLSLEKIGYFIRELLCRHTSLFNYIISCYKTIDINICRKFIIDANFYRNSIRFSELALCLIDITKCNVWTILRAIVRPARRKEGHCHGCFKCPDLDVVRIEIKYIK